MKISLYDEGHPVVKQKLQQTPPSRIIYATYTETTVRVYQAYSPAVALPALKLGRFDSNFKLDRMTWIKPSFNWMMYRSGYGTKPEQQIILSIDLSRHGFDWALQNAVLSSFDPCVHPSREAWQEDLRKSCVRVQWDPERDWKLNRLNSLRTIQIGLSGNAIHLFVKEWIIDMTDVSEIARELLWCKSANQLPTLLPDQSNKPYPVSTEVKLRLGILR